MKFTDSSAWKQAITLEPTFLELAKQPKVNGNPSYICPTCGHGKGGDGIARKGNEAHKKWKCFGGCGSRGDILELWQQHTGTKNENKEKCFQDMCQALGLNYNAQSFNRERTETIKQSQQQSIEKTKKRITEQSQSNNRRDYSDYYARCHADINKTDEFTGIRQHVLDEFQLGYDVNHNSLIIPYDNFGYVERFIVPEKTNFNKSGSKYRASPGTVRGLFNIKCLEKNRPVFLVEGERDALAIISCGFDAVATGGAAHKGILEKLEELKKTGKEIPLIIIATDNDKAGKDQADKWEKELKSINIIYSRPTDLYGDMKDARDCLEDNEQDLILNLEDAMNKDPIYLLSELNYLENFEKDIREPTPSIPTGFNQLDQILGGGLHEGLYVVGAVSSLGKTTLVMQIAAQVAQTGQPVGIYSLEMSRKELTAKALSRESYILSRDSIGGPSDKALTSLEIIKYGLQNYNPKRVSLLVNCFSKYKSYADNLFIKDDVSQIKPDEIRRTIELYKQIRGKAPVIIMDYLQLITWNKKDDIRKNIDDVVSELKQIVKDYHIPVIVISSFNRSSYKDHVNMGAFKESGGIEYTSDVLIGLQFKGVSQTKGESEREEFLAQARKKSPRDIELVILKNRNGTSGDKMNFLYYQKFNYFREG